MSGSRTVDCEDPIAALNLTLYWNRHDYPIYFDHEDQWGESGWVFDPLRFAYIRFEIDRKNQSDYEWSPQTPTQMASDILPGATEGLRGWFSSHDVLRCDDAVWVHWRDRSVLVRYDLQRLEAAQGRATEFAVERSVAEAIASSEDLRRWLEP
ncbi:MAG: hypothetical protein KC561_07935 [Myxococcales bacterium]|nr:hypothetical protein [Myxococcales bacterium]